MWARGLHIAISGLIGAGKTTLSQKISTSLGLPLYCEKVTDNKCLEEFYKDQKRNAFLLQISLLAQRLRQQYVINWTTQGGIQDRSIYEDLIFCRMLLASGMLSRLEYETYFTLWNDLSSQLPRPDIIVHLKVDPETSLQRIQQRGREMENGITLEYLHELSTAYDEFLHELSRNTFVIVLEWSEFIDHEIVIEKIKQVWETSPALHYINLK